MHESCSRDHVFSKVTIQFQQSGLDVFRVDCRRGTGTPDVNEFSFRQLLLSFVMINDGDGANACGDQLGREGRIGPLTVNRRYSK
jgi:hypothetical protein